MPTSVDDVAHLFRRAGFGGTAQEINALKLLDRAALVSKVVDVHEPEITNPGTSPDVMTQDREWDIVYPLSNWWMQKMANSKMPLIEKMTLFWHGHFTSSLDKVHPQPMWEQNRMFRTLGMGSFQTLTQTVFKHAAVLTYLDNSWSRADALNENFGRELMELYLLGHGNYTQNDVRAMARAWSGHATTPDSREYKWMPEWHDTGQKTFMGTTRNWDGPDLVNALFAGAKTRPIIANHISQKMWEFFAYKDPEPQLVSSLATTFLHSNLNVRELLRAIFTHDEFYSTKAKQGHVRSPVEYVVAAAKYSGIPFTVTSPLQAPAHDIEMGQVLFKPPNVAGWPGGTAWSNASAWWTRGWYARRVADTRSYQAVLVDTNNMTPATATHTALARFGILNPSNATVTAITNGVTEARKYSVDEARNTLIVMTLMSSEFHVA